MSDGGGGRAGDPDGSAHEAVRIDVVALDDLTLEVAEGEVFGYLGPNGAGKSTTLRLLLGLIKPTAGRAEIKGIDVARTTDVHSHLAYVPGDVSLWPRLTGEECLELFGRLQGGVDETYRSELVDRFELDLSKRARAYSKGNRQKVALVAAFAPATGRAAARRTDERPRSADGAAVPALRPRGERARTDDLPVVAHPLGGGGAVRQGRHPPCRPTRRGVVGRRALRQMHTSELEIDFHGEPPDLANVDGVESVERTPNGLRVKLIGSPSGVLAAISDNGVTALRSQEASLEEIFLAYYGDTDERVGHDDDPS